jgi:hypothetical protein
MSLAAGDTFFAPWPEPDGMYHLFFVVSDPARDRNQVLVVPMMTWADYRESICILEPGDHRFVRHTSYIDYGCAEVATATYIEKRIDSSEFRTHDPASPDLLARIRAGAGRSDFLKLGFRDILEEQDLVGPL